VIQKYERLWGSYNRDYYESEWNRVAYVMEGSDGDSLDEFIVWAKLQFRHLKEWGDVLLRATDGRRATTLTGLLRAHPKPMFVGRLEVPSGDGGEAAKILFRAAAVDKYLAALGFLKEIEGRPALKEKYGNISTDMKTLCADARRGFEKLRGLFRGEPYEVTVTSAWNTFTAEHCSN
jgi:hypothetical protein